MTDSAQGSLGYAQIAVAAPIRTLFTYEVPKALAPLAPGLLVEVPFGRGKRRGVIISLGSTAPAGLNEIKPIGRVVEPLPLLEPALLSLLTWAWEYYLAPPGEMIFAALPPAFHLMGKTAQEKKARRVIPTPLVQEEILTHLEQRAPQQAKLMRLLLQSGGLDLAEVCRKLPNARSQVAGLVKKGLLRQEDRLVPRRPKLSDLPMPAPVKHLNTEQKQAYAQVEQAMEQGQYHAFLLHGVTGSGKTEVYLRAIGHALAHQRGSILLVPEISLTPQLISRVMARFGDQVAVLHSALSEGERQDEWRRLRSGACLVAVGARSAVFAPVPRLGVIIVDEEHDASYKQSDRLPYNGRDLAMVRARVEQAVVILGTATPSVESYFHALSRRSTLLTLHERVAQRSLPQVEVIDLKRELDTPLERFHTLGPQLAQALAETLDRGEQAILFLNRRGYSSYALCRDCGEAIRCENCSVSLVHHLKEQCLRCHYCGRTRGVPQSCPACQGGRVALFGLGTEKCEEEVRRRFPGAKVVRLDSDSTSARGNLHDIISRFARGQIDVLVGTQMVTKGHDIPGVTLVGVLLADLGLQLPDFRAAERTFQQLLQVSGRAGRGDQPGRVIIQSFLPNHPSIVMAKEHRYEDFFKRELSKREQLGYPPFRRLLMARVSHLDPDAAKKSAELVADTFRGAGQGKIQLLGPVASPLSKIRNRYRWQMLIKAASVRELQMICQEVQKKLRAPAGVRIIFDVDPIDML